jgi:hypothetical protein
MDVQAEPEQVETTGSERVLASVLAVFVAIGLIWGYYKLDEVDSVTPFPRSAESSSAFRADIQSINAHERAGRDVRNSRARVARARRELELRREALRTAVELGEPSAPLNERYQEAQRDFAAARDALTAAGEREQATSGEARAAEQRISAANREADEKFDSERRNHDRLVFGLRLALALSALAGSLWLMGRIRRDRSRFVPLALAAVSASAALALLMALDYTWDYLEFEDVGPLTISIAGIALTVAAFIRLQRFITEQLPLRRVRRGECPYCGFPVRENRSCEGCGRQVVSECSTCHAPRRVGTRHCGACGAA